MPRRSSAPTRGCVPCTRLPLFFLCLLSSHPSPAWIPASLQFCFLHCLVAGHCFLCSACPPANHQIAALHNSPTPHYTLQNTPTTRGTQTSISTTSPPLNSLQNTHNATTDPREAAPDARRHPPLRGAPRAPASVCACAPAFARSRRRRRSLRRPFRARIVLTSHLHHPLDLPTRNTQHTPSRTAARAARARPARRRRSTPPSPRSSARR